MTISKIRDRVSKELDELQELVDTFRLELDALGEDIAEYNEIEDIEI